ncbi:DUF4198 domain-containing protein [Acinetobacter sp. YH12063]|uniref:DUF4198 domain-containing protein n=1 Tax=Acinetobacter sp. YH12063 TaxID=2601061 RepID=UPI0015D431D0|nr:DUF4198 domain-containing protein [Acinetobacter sp. YH12063]
MKLQFTLLCLALCTVGQAQAHYPYVAPLNYQTFNNHSAILSGFYDNPFVSEIAIKNFNFHVHTPSGDKLHLADADWAKTQTVSSYSLENKQDGTYRIRGEKQGSTARYAYDQKQWKALINGVRDPQKTANANVIYTAELTKKSQIKSIQTQEIIETFVSRRATSTHVVNHLHDGFDVQFKTHPNAIKQNEPVQLKVLDQKKAVAGLQVEILQQTTDYSREGKVYKTLKTDQDGNLNLNLADRGQYLLKIDYQQPFEMKGDALKRYKYTLSFNVI